MTVSAYAGLVTNVGVKSRKVGLSPTDTGGPLASGFIGLLAGSVGLGYWWMSGNGSVVFNSLDQ